MLKQNDTIGIIALSSECDKRKVKKAKANLESLGFKVKLSKNIFDKHRYLAGSDDDKVLELHNFFQNDEINLIMCARGGYGTTRIIDKIDYDIIKTNPKPFCGFSDATAVLLMIYKKTGLVTYYSPMACTDFTGNIDAAAIQPFVFSGEHAPSAVRRKYSTILNYFKAVNNEHLRYEGLLSYKEGFAKGILWGGNLSTIVSLCGQDFIPDRDFIFFTEDINEPVYKIDRMFQQLINIPQFVKHCKGLVLGDFLEVDNVEWLDEYFIELSKRLNIPLSGGFKITHSEEKITIPIGKRGILNNNVLFID